MDWNDEGVRIIGRGSHFWSLIYITPNYRLIISQEVRSDDTFRIPVIDFSRFASVSATTQQRRETAKEIVTAFKEVGFVYLKNHGIGEDVVNNAFKKVRTIVPLSGGKR